MTSQFAELRQVLEQRKRELGDPSDAPDRHQLKNAKQIAAEHAQERRAAFLAALGPATDNAELCALMLDLVEYVNTHIARSKWSEHLCPVCFEMNENSPACRSRYEVLDLADIALKCVGMALQMRICGADGGRRFFWVLCSLPAVEVTEDFRTPAFANLSATLLDEIKDHWIDVRIRIAVGRLLEMAKKHSSRRIFAVPSDACDFVITEELEKRLSEEQIGCTVDYEFVSQPARKPRYAPPRAQSRILGDVGRARPTQLRIVFELDE